MIHFKSIGCINTYYVYTVSFISTFQSKNSRIRVHSFPGLQFRNFSLGNITKIFTAFCSSDKIQESFGIKVTSKLNRSIYTFNFFVPTADFYRLYAR